MTEGKECLNAFDGREIPDKKNNLAMHHMDAPQRDAMLGKEDSVKKTVNLVGKDLKALQEGGVNGIIFSNKFS